MASYFEKMENFPGKYGQTGGIPHGQIRLDWGHVNIKANQDHNNTTGGTGRTLACSPCTLACRIYNYLQHIHDRFKNLVS